MPIRMVLVSYMSMTVRMTCLLVVMTLAMPLMVTLLPQLLRSQQIVCVGQWLKQELLKLSNALLKRLLGNLSSMTRKNLM